MYAMDRTIHEEHRPDPRRRRWGSRRQDTLRPASEPTRRRPDEPTPAADDFAD